MFIKILTPNHNGKIELTVRDLEALIEEAVEKAIREKCAGCYRNYSTGVTYLNSNDNPNLDWTKVTCSTSDAITTLRKEGFKTFNETKGEEK